VNFDQGQFNFDAEGSEDGYRRWREDLDERKRAFESRWGVILSRKVSVSLKNHAKPVTGTIEWATRTKRGGADNPVFRIRSVEFTTAEIESIIQLDGD
jgi:hypothetical protein